MTLREFVKRNRADITWHVHAICGNCGKLSLGDLEDWVMNDSFLYDWARESGVKV